MEKIINYEEFSERLNTYVELLYLVSNHSGVAFSSTNLNELGVLKTPGTGISYSHYDKITHNEFNLLNGSFRFVDFISFVNVCHLLNKRNIKIDGISPKMRVISSNRTVGKLHEIMRNRLFIDLDVEFFRSNDKFTISVYVNELMAFNIGKKEGDNIESIIETLFDTSKTKAERTENCNNFISGLDEEHLIIVYSNIF